MNDRSWAKDVSDKDWENEFTRRHPVCGGSIPARDAYISFTPKRTEDINIDYQEEPLEVKEVKVDTRFEIYKCVCDRDVKGLVGFNSHKSHCKQALNQR